MRLPEAEAQVGEGEADAVRGGGELLVEEDEAERAKEVERPGDRPRDED
jgi:hypothetical protein